MTDKLKSSWKTSIKDGQYKRAESQFRHWITDDGNAGVSGESGFKAEADRYHLYVSLACPWAHRTLIFRHLKGLDGLISVSVVHPDMHEKGWHFQHDDHSQQTYATTGDVLYGSNYLSSRYHETVANYKGNITVPVLWDKKQKCIVNNESADIIRMFNSAFDSLTGNQLDYYPEALRPEIDAVNALVYHNINNGVYKTGFATSQSAYEQNCKSLFAALDDIEKRLSTKNFLAGNHITEADWRLFTTLVRFDAVYHTHFKCNVRLIKEYLHIYPYMLTLFQQPGIAQTVHMAHIKRHYYASHLSINPHGIIPLGHQQDWSLTQIV